MKIGEWLKPCRAWDDRECVWERHRTRGRECVGRFDRSRIGDWKRTRSYERKERTSPLSAQVAALLTHGADKRIASRRDSSPPSLFRFSSSNSFFQVPPLDRSIESARFRIRGLQVDANFKRAYELVPGSAAPLSLSRSIVRGSLLSVSPPGFEGRGFEHSVGFRSPMRRAATVWCTRCASRSRTSRRKSTRFARQNWERASSKSSGPQRRGVLNNGPRFATLPHSGLERERDTRVYRDARTIVCSAV